MTTSVVYFLSDAGYPKSPVEAACPENDDGSDLCSVQLHLQGPHPVSPQLQAHMSSSVCMAQHTRSSQKILGWSFSKFKQVQTALWWCSWINLVNEALWLNQARLKEWWCGYTRKKQNNMKEHKDLWSASKQYYIYYFLHALLLNKAQHFHSTLMYIMNQRKAAIKKSLL